MSALQRTRARGLLNGIRGRCSLIVALFFAPKDIDKEDVGKDRAWMLDERWSPSSVSRISFAVAIMGGCPQESCSAAGHEEFLATVKRARVT